MVLTQSISKSLSMFLFISLSLQQQRNGSGFLRGAAAKRFGKIYCVSSFPRWSDISYAPQFLKL